MTVQGTFTDVPSSTVFVLFEAKGDGVLTSTSPEPIHIEPTRTDYQLEIDTDFTLNGQLTINSGGYVYVHGVFGSAATSSISIDNGSFIADSPNHGKGWEYISGNLTMTDGLFEVTNNSIILWTGATTNISGGILRTGGAFGAYLPGVFQPTGGVAELTGSLSSDNAIYCYNGNYFHDLLVNRTGDAAQFMAGEPVVIQNDFTVDNGVIMSGTSEISVSGNVEINSGGKLELNDIGSLTMGASKSITVNNGGILELNGNITDQAKISRISSGNYALNIESGGTISAEYGIFEYMNTNGVNIKPGAIVDPAKPLNNCTFRNGGERRAVNHNKQ